MRFLIIVTLVLAGCSEPESAKLERQYAILEKSDRSPETLCAKANEVAQAYLAEEKAEQFEKWSTYSAGNCAAARNEQPIL